MSAVNVPPPRPPAPQDSPLRQAVREEIEWDTRVDSGKAAIGVDVHEGTVTLTGRVSSCSERSAAQDAAHRVTGVLDVVDEIHVSPPGSAPALRPATVPSLERSTPPARSTRDAGNRSAPA